MILSAGALDSPKLLLLSGIGPKEELAKHDISVIHNLPGIGRNLRDHLWLELVTTQKLGSRHRTSYLSSPDALQEARAQWVKDQRGPLSNCYLPQMIGYLKSERVKNSREFKQLDSAVQQHFQAETKPNYELISVSVRNDCRWHESLCPLKNIPPRDKCYTNSRNIHFENFLLALETQVT